MMLNIDVNNEELLKTLNEILVKYEQVEEHAKKLHFLTIKEVADILRLLNKNKSRYF